MCPSKPVSICVALADKLELLVGLWSIGEKPSGSKDPFALRRSALGVIRLLLENNLNKKGDILIFIDSKNSDVVKRLKRRKNFNKKLFNKFQKIQFSSQYKIRKSNFIIKNDFTKKTININIKDVKKKINQ